jgi:hypothetical protein
MGMVIQKEETRYKAIHRMFDGPHTPGVGNFLAVLNKFRGLWVTLLKNKELNITLLHETLVNYIEKYLPQAILCLPLSHTVVFCAIYIQFGFRVKISK